MSFLPLLLIALAISAYSTYTGVKDYAELIRTKERSRLYLRWISQSWLIFALPAATLLLLAGHIHYLFEPIARSDSSAFISLSGNNEHDTSVIIGVVVGLVIAAFIVGWRVKRSLKKRREAPQEALIPTTTKERWLAVGMSVTAGITEELFFRAMLPALLFLVTGNVAVSMGLALLVFGIEHLYGGWKVVLATTVIGWVFLKLFMSSGTIFVPMAVHALLDINGLIVMPYLAKKGIFGKRA